MENKITTTFAMLETLKANGIPASVVDDIELWFDVIDMRKVVESNDTIKLKELRNIGDKRAAKIIEILKGRIPGAMTKPVPDLKKPDDEMYAVQNLNLIYDENRTAKLTKRKVSEDGKFIIEDGTVVDDIAKKRFGPALQYLQKISEMKNGVTFTTVSLIQEDVKDSGRSYMMNRYWKQVVTSGIRMKDGRKFVPFMIGTNAKMKGQIHWADEKYAERVKQWCACGAKLNNAQKIAKLEAYYGLLLPYTHPLLCNTLNPTMEIITPEWENVHKGKNVLIDPDGTMHDQDEYTVSEFDGQMFIHIPEELKQKMGLTRHELRRLNRAIAKFNGGTLRGPWHKGIIIVGYDIHAALHEAGVDTINGKNIDDIAMFGDKTVFKAAIGEDGLYEKFEDFADNFIKLQHRFGVLLENHGIKHTFLPSQQLQAAHGADLKYIKEGAKAEVEYLNAAKDNKVAATRYAPRVIARIAGEDPSIVGTWFAKDMINNSYKAELEAAMTGRTHGNSVSGFVIKDPQAYVEWIAYVEGKRTELPQGMLGAYQVYAPTAGFTGKAVASRNPVIANYGLHTVEVIDDVGEYNKYFEEGFDYLVVSIHDALCKLLRMDHDGDKMRLTNAKWFIDAVESIEKDGSFAEWTSFGEVMKAVPTREAELEFFAGCTQSPTLGLNVDTCGLMISNGVIKKVVHEYLMDYLMNKGTDVKQGADGSNVDGEAGEIWNDMQKNRENFVYSIAQAMGKSLKGRTIKSEKVAKEYRDNNLDIISEEVEKNAVKELEFEDTFDVLQVLINGARKISGLCRNGKKNKETGEYEDEGLFNILVARKSAEWNEIDKEDSMKVGWQEFQAWKKQEALKELYEYGQILGFNEDDVYDAVTTYVFLELKKARYGKNVSEDYKNWLDVMARTYLEWFGDKLEETFCCKKGLEALAAVPEGVDLGEDSPF